MDAVTAVLSAAEVDGSTIGPGGWGFWIVIGLLVALFFLYRSMRKQLGRVQFEEPDDERPHQGRAEPRADT
jgi:hypothetical protein